MKLLKELQYKMILRYWGIKPQMCAELRQIFLLNGCPSEVQSKDPISFKTKEEIVRIIYLTLA